MGNDELTAGVVDDNETSRVLVSAVVRKLGVRPTGIATEAAFLRALATASGSTPAPDLVVLDLYLPWRDKALLAENRLAGALACLEKLKGAAATRGVPVVIFSAFAQDDLVKEQLRPYQPAAIIDKSENSARLLMVIDNVLPNRPRRTRDVVRRFGLAGEHELLRISALIGALTAILTLVGILVRWFWQVEVRRNRLRHGDDDADQPPALIVEDVS
jgi:CheY-like chemotaxis protein